MMAEKIRGLNLVLLGRSGIGKSASGNTILGKEAFKSKKSSSSVTRDVAVESGSVCGRWVTVYDTPGLFSTELSDHEIQHKLIKTLQRCESDPCVFLLVIKADRFTEKERETVEMIEKLLGEERLEKTWILFTRGDELEEDNMTIQEFINLSEPLKKVVQKYDQRYHVFNNKMKQSEQVRLLLEKISQRLKALGIFKMEQMKCLNMVLLGKTGAGKSASGNTILGRQAFVSRKSSRSVTRDVVVESGSVGDIEVTVYDTPGLFNTDTNEDEIQKKYEEVLQRCESGPCVFLLVIKADRFTAEERETVKKLEKLLGEERLKKTWILFTRGDELEEDNMTIQEFINESEELKNLVQKYEQRYHVFNNKRGHIEQVQMLFIKVLKPYFDIQEGEVLETLKPNPLVRKIPQYFEPAAPVSSLSPRRLVLLGKSGIGKSAAGNTILGQRVFNSVMRMNSVTSECLEAHATVSDRSVSVVDTPGFFDTKMNPEELAEEIARSVYLSSPGPHAFLIVFPVNMRFTEQEQQITQMIEMMFGEEVLKYSIILFTHGDLLEDKSVEKLIEENCRVRDLVQKCGDRYHVFNNKDLNNREQVNDLLQKIDSMIEKNGGGYYSNQMYEDAQRFRREEEEQRQREVEQRKQQEKKQREEEIGRVMKETEERVRAERMSEEQRREEIERVMKETEERVRAEYEAKRQRDEEKRRREENVKKEGGFKQFFSKHKKFFIWGAVVVVCGGALGALAVVKYMGGVAAVKAIGGVAVVKVIGGAVVGGAAGGAVFGGAVAKVAETATVVGKRDE